MIFWTWRSYFIRWQIFENKVWCPVSKKIRRYFHFLLSLAYPIDRLDWSLFSAVIVFYHWFPLLDKIEIRAYILPRNFPAVFIIFTGRGGAGNPPFPAGRVPRGTGRPSLYYTRCTVQYTQLFGREIRFLCKNQFNIFDLLTKTLFLVQNDSHILYYMFW